MEILLQHNYHIFSTDIQQQLDSKEAQIKNLSEQIEENSANMQAQEAEIQELRVEVKMQQVEIQTMRAELQEKTKELQEKTRELQEKTQETQEKTRDLQEKTRDLQENKRDAQEKIKELQEQRVQMQKELSDKTIGLANCIKEIESIKISLATNQQKVQETMTLHQPQKNPEKGHESNGVSQLIGSSNANKAEEVFAYTSANKKVRYVCLITRQQNKDRIGYIIYITTA